MVARGKKTWLINLATRRTQDGLTLESVLVAWLGERVVAPQTASRLTGINVLACTLVFATTTLGFLGIKWRQPRHWHWPVIRQPSLLSCPGWPR